MELNIVLEKIIYEENTGLSQNDITNIEKEIDFIYPIEYVEMLMKYDGGYGHIGEFYIDFWEMNDILFYYDENEDIKDLIIFASDGGGMAFAFQKRDKSICSIPMDSLEKGYAKKIADNYVDFLKKIYTGELEY